MPRRESARARRVGAGMEITATGRPLFVEIRGARVPGCQPDRGGGRGPLAPAADRVGQAAGVHRHYSGPFGSAAAGGRRRAERGTARGRAAATATVLAVR